MTKPIDPAKYDEHAIDRLAVAILQNAVDTVNVVDKTKTGYIEALQAAEWLDKEGREWLELLDIGVPSQSFSAWLKLDTARWKLTDAAKWAMIRLIDQLPQEIGA